MNDETMDEIASTTVYRGIVSCLMCGDMVPGLTRTEAVEDAYRIGWEHRTPGGWRCAACIDEEANL